MVLYCILLLIVDLSPIDILLSTQAPIFVWFDGTIIDIISTILVTMYYSDYVELWLVAVHGD